LFICCLYRFIILRKRPTCRKVCFAGLVLLAEIIALIPSIFPALEGTKAHSNDISLTTGKKASFIARAMERTIMYS
jgi:hypothetical protein